MLLEYSDGRTGLTTTAFRYRITQADGTLVKDWTTGATWTESPAGTYTLTDAAGLAGMRYEVEPATGEVGAVGTWDADVLTPLTAVGLRTASLPLTDGTAPLTFRSLLDTDGDGTADVPNVGVAGIEYRLTSDAAGLVQVQDVKTTDTQGYARWYGLADGTYYVWPTEAGYTGPSATVTVPEA